MAESGTANNPLPDDPDQYRMSLGDHLTELRRRLIFALLGLAVALGFCLIFGKQVTTIFCQPLVDSLQSQGFTPQLYYTELPDNFMVYINISLISAVALASPWILWQMWQFVATGLYKHERRMMQKYAPLSLALLLSGMALVYWLVLPWSIIFFIQFGQDVQLNEDLRPSTATTQMVEHSALQVPAYAGDPVHPQDRDFWLNTTENRLKMFIGNQVKIIPFQPSSLTAPIITLPEYISLVMGMLVTFGLSFQLPLAVVALVKMGLLPHQVLKSGRRYVYFALTIVACAITPGDVITSSVALLLPLAGLYEMGIWLSRPKAGATEAGDASGEGTSSGDDSSSGGPGDPTPPAGE